MLEHQYEADFEMQLKRNRAEAVAREYARNKQMEADERTRKGIENQQAWEEHNREKEARRQRNKENLEKNPKE
jgi:hypothetical protein